MSAPRFFTDEDVYGAVAIAMSRLGFETVSASGTHHVESDTVLPLRRLNAKVVRGGLLCLTYRLMPRVTAHGPVLCCVAQQVTGPVTVSGVLNFDVQQDITDWRWKRDRRAGR